MGSAEDFFNVLECIKRGDAESACNGIFAHPDVASLDKRSRLLWFALEASLSDVVRALILCPGYKTRLDAEWPFNWKPLHLAAAESCCDCVEILLRAGASAEEKDMYGHTPLFIATYRRVVLSRTLKGMMMGGACVDGTLPASLKREIDRLERTLLAGADGIIKLLISYGADPKRMFDGRPLAERVSFFVATVLQELSQCRGAGDKFYWPSIYRSRRRPYYVMPAALPA